MAHFRTWKRTNVSCSSKTRHNFLQEQSIIPVFQFMFPNIAVGGIESYNSMQEISRKWRQNVIDLRNQSICISLLLISLTWMPQFCPSYQKEWLKKSKSNHAMALVIQLQSRVWQLPTHQTMSLQMNHRKSRSPVPAAALLLQCIVRMPDLNRFASPEDQSYTITRPRPFVNPSDVMCLTTSENHVDASPYVAPAR